MTTGSCVFCELGLKGCSGRAAVRHWSRGGCRRKKSVKLGICRREVQPAIAGGVDQPADERLGLGPPRAIGGQEAEDLLAQHLRSAAPEMPSSGLSWHPRPLPPRSPPRQRENNPASHAAPPGRRSSPIAIPPRGFRAFGTVVPGGLNTPNGRFCSGNSACPLAEATQLWRARSWVSSIILNPPWQAPWRRRHSLPGARGVHAGFAGAGAGSRRLRKAPASKLGGFLPSPICPACDAHLPKRPFTA